MAGLDRRRVTLRGALIYGHGTLLAEIEDRSVVAAGVGSMREIRVDLGRREFVGEIVDSKCTSGAMKPGLGKPHRSRAS